MSYGWSIFVEIVAVILLTACAYFLVVGIML